MKSLIGRIFLKESITCKGSIAELKEKLQQENDCEFSVKWISDNEFKFLANFSVGTIILDDNAAYFDGIKGYAKLIALEKGKTEIVLTTKLRIELFFTGILSFVFPIFFFFSNENLPFWLLFMFPIVTIWFWFVYRFQEKRLFKKVKKHIKNQTY
ncbi:hypothetical protein U8527_15235 [Kordia algicida OT-1]|uniref:Uncharacterized protein n=1 Tax=Kordia algicida OT-1 TaxID=391587 RepID=A9E7K3_9FLAO|nr:hypothetical protein [Kordia algicida]EDP94907.1 hypothetical protein KAOT1_08839 [Kordia algicida OT-1]